MDKPLMSKDTYVGIVWLFVFLGILLSFTFGWIYSITLNVNWLYYMASSDWLIGVGCGLAWAHSVRLK